MFVCFLVILPVILYDLCAAFGVINDEWMQKKRWWQETLRRDSESVCDCDTRWVIQYLPWVCYDDLLRKECSQV